MSHGKIDPKIAAMAQYAAQYTDGAVDAEAVRAATELRDATTPNANERLNQGVAWAVDSYNAAPMEVVAPLDVTPTDSPAMQELQLRVDRLEQTLKDLCRGQMLLDKGQELFDG